MNDKMYEEIAAECIAEQQRYEEKAQYWAQRAAYYLKMAEKRKETQDA